MNFIKQSILDPLCKDIKKNVLLYMLILPVLAYYIIFCYVPIYGLQIAFKDFIPSKGFWGSPFVGFDHFERFFNSYTFWDLMRNTLGISTYSLVVGFPLSVIFALLLNYLPFKPYQKSIQMVSYAPHFISTVVMVGMITIFLNQEKGLVNQFREALGFSSIAFLSIPSMFKSIYVWSGVWQGIGWSSIIYISALTGVDYQLHEAAIMDGATKLRRIISIDIPSIRPTIVMLLILQIGGIMNVGFEKIFLMQNDLNRSASDVISTYVYRVGLQGGEYSFSTAVGLFNSIINFVLLLTFNKLSKRFGQVSLW